MRALKFWAFPSHINRLLDFHLSFKHCGKMFIALYVHLLFHLEECNFPSCPLRSEFTRHQSLALGEESWILLAPSFLDVQGYPWFHIQKPWWVSLGLPGLNLSDNIKPILLSGWMLMLISSAFWSPVGINPHSLPMLIMPVANWLIPPLLSSHLHDHTHCSPFCVSGQHLLFLCGRTEINEWEILWSGTSLCSLWAWNHFLRILGVLGYRAEVRLTLGAAAP